MSVEFIGYIGHFNSSETVRRKGLAIDVDHIEAVAKAHEYVGFDRALVAFNSTSAESILVGQHAASVTERLKLMIAHRPGFTAPTLAARQLATLDHVSRGRLAVHIITGGNDSELAQDGDALSKDERYARTSEYLDIVKQEWLSPEPFDYEGVYYRVKRGFGDIKPYRPEGIPVFFGGASEAAIQVAGTPMSTRCMAKPMSRWASCWAACAPAPRCISANRLSAFPFAPSWPIPKRKPGRRRTRSWRARRPCAMRAATSMR
jgi:alkanesulfonate monooxygenase